jgi:hypothetical protein
VTFTVYNTLGKQVIQLVNGNIDVGDHEVKFDAVGLASGVYFYPQQAGNIIQTRRFLVLK